MFRLLLVDDEPIIVEGLYEQFKDYEAVNLDVYKAYSAKDALDWLNKKKIDIVITDIKMPGMDGLQLLEKIKLNWPECRVIFLTGHDEFNYIYKAIRYEGVSYLLKTESYESIAAMVDRYLEEIINSYKNDELVKNAENKMRKALPLLQKEFLSGLVEGMESTEISQQTLDELELPLNADLPVILLAGCIVNVPDKNGYLNQSNIYAVNYTVEQYLSPYASVTGFIYQKDYMLWFIQPKTENHSLRLASNKEAAHYFKNVLESVQSLCRVSINLKVSFAISSDAVSWSEIFHTGGVLKTLLNSLMRQGMEVIVTDEQYREHPVKADREQQNIQLQLKKLDMLATYIEQGKKEDFYHLFYEMRDFFVHRLPEASSDYEAYYAITLLFLSYINRHDLKEAVTAGMGNNSLWESRSYTTMEEAFRLFEQVADILFDVQTVESEKRSMASIQKVQDYIQHNLGEDLSLNSLADMVFFNPKYLSRLFKQVTGFNLSDYINEKKLAKSKELLKQSHIKIHEIAKAVGYSSGPYFTKFFKKGTNMTPQEYRDLH